MRTLKLVIPCLVMLTLVVNILPAHAGTTNESGESAPDWTAPLRREAQTLGKPAWRPMLQYLAGLHARATHPPVPPFILPWEDIGPGYNNGTGFGHIDLVHEILDVLPSATVHARRQLFNNLQQQLENGLMPGVIWIVPGKPPSFNREKSYPPLWVTAADDYFSLTGDRALLAEFIERAALQMLWFEQNRRATPQGYYYIDIFHKKWESGMDEGVRYDEIATEPRACIDATAHVYQICDCLVRWNRLTGGNPTGWEEHTARLREFIQTRLWDEKDGFFYDIRAIENPALRHQTFEGIWPVVVGAATRKQAERVIDEWLLNPKRFFTPHPIATVGASDPRFELRMWRGPAWNSMTYWAARGCLRYGRKDAARRLLEAALDDSARQFARTGTIWEFYHPFGDFPEKLARKPKTAQKQPCSDYVGHNPLFAMARMWEACGGKK